MYKSSQWEKKSSIRNRPWRVMTDTEGKYFFPPSEQPLCFHPKIIARGEEAKNYILTQSAYSFMRTIFIHETQVINAIANKIIKNKSTVRFSPDVCHDLLTVVIDESYHAYVAHDYIKQVTRLTNIQPIHIISKTSLYYALIEVKKTIPQEYQFFFEIIAACIAENSITKELVSIAKDPQVNTLFYQINDDHILDEGRHCVIFSHILTYLWQEISEEARNILGPALSVFIQKYLSRDISARIDKKILQNLELQDYEINSIIYDTYVPVANPIIKNIHALLQRTGVLAHKNTANFLNLENTQDYKIIPWKLSFLEASPKKLVSKKISYAHLEINTEKNILEICALFLLYLQNISQLDNISFMFLFYKYYKKYIPMIFCEDKNKRVSEVLEEFKEKVDKTLYLAAIHDEKVQIEHVINMPLCIYIGDDFTYDKNYSTAIQVNFLLNNKKNNIINIYFDVNLFDSNNINTLLDNFMYFADMALKNISCFCCELPLVSKKHQELLDKYSGTSAKKNELSVIELIEKKVSKQPSKIAIIDNNQAISYENLNTQANLVAHNLKNKGLKKGDIIIVMLDHGYEYVSILLGIMKAHMVILPLARNTPRVRLLNILGETNAKLIVINESLKLKELNRLKSSTPQQLFLAQHQEYKNSEQIILDSLAYIIYTSGSTGEPKGVMVTHRSLVNFAEALIKLFPIKTQDRVLQFSPSCFDPSFAEIISTLISGALLCIRPKNILASCEHFFAECERLEITVLNLPTTLWYELIRDNKSWPKLLGARLKTMVIGGEALRPFQLEQWYNNILTPIKLLNTYGPTETTIAVTACDLNRYSSLRIKESLIGTPIANAVLFVLDKYLRFLPLGVPGELYVGGPGVSRGYYNQPITTKERFLDFNNNKYKGIIYKTGDRVKWIKSKSNAVLAFIGRDDRQIKLRGFRIELGEIEQALNNCKHVGSAKVLYNKNKENSYIAAFVVAESNSLTVKKLQIDLLNILPEYMQPHRIYIIKKWPMTMHNKIDENALINMISCDNFSNIKNNNTCLDAAVETRLNSIWQKVLGISEIHNNSDFFRLGGHSLLAMRLLALINEEFHLGLSVRNIFETPEFLKMVALVKKNISPNFSGPLSYAQENLWLIDQKLNLKSINYNIAYALEFIGNLKLNYSSLEKSINYIINRHKILRTVFQVREGVLRQVVIEHAIKLKPQRISVDDFKQLALEDARTPFDLASLPPVRIQLFIISKSHHILLINHHHIIHDGHSIYIFLRELFECYEKFNNNKEPDLPVLPIDYLDFARNQRTATKALWTPSLEYWRHKLAHIKPWGLPFCRRDALRNASEGEYHRFALESSLCGALKVLCQRENCTLFVLILAAIYILFYFYSKEEDISFLVAMSTREYHHDDQLMGLFVNSVIMRHHINNNNYFAEFLREIKTSFYEATNHRFLDLDTIIKELKLDCFRFGTNFLDIEVIFHNKEHNLTHFSSTSLAAKIEFIKNKTTRSGLTINIYEFQDIIDVELEYSSDLYDLKNIITIQRDFTRVLSGIIKNNYLRLQSILDVLEYHD